MKRPLFYSWLFYWFCATLGGSFISFLAFLILTFDRWCHVLICQCNFLFPLEDLRGWILLYMRTKFLKMEQRCFLMFLNSSVERVTYWCVICKATCDNYTHWSCDSLGRMYILLSFRHEFLMCQNILRNYWAVLQCYWQSTLLTLGQSWDLSSRNFKFAFPVFPEALMCSSMRSPPELQASCSGDHRTPGLLPQDLQACVCWIYRPSKLEHSCKKPGVFLVQDSLWFIRSFYKLALSY